MKRNIISGTRSRVAHKLQVLRKIKLLAYERAIEDTVRQGGNEKRKESRKNKDLRKQEEKMHLE